MITRPRPPAATSRPRRLTLVALASRPHRLSELHRAIPDIFKRMLIQTLREPERDGLLEREVFPTKPPSVRYSLSPLGRSVLSPVSALVAWAEDSYPAVRAARARFDAAGKSIGTQAPSRG